MTRYVSPVCAASSALVWAILLLKQAETALQLKRYGNLYGHDLVGVSVSSFGLALSFFLLFVSVRRPRAAATIISCLCMGIGLFFLVVLGASAAG